MICGTRNAELFGSLSDPSDQEVREIQLALEQAGPVAIEEVACFMALVIIPAVPHLLSCFGLDQELLPKRPARLNYRQGLIGSGGEIKAFSERIGS